MTLQKNIFPFRRCSTKRSCSAKIALQSIFHSSLFLKLGEGEIEEDEGIDFEILLHFEAAIVAE